MAVSTNSKLPQDANNNPFNRAMGVPTVCRTKIVGSATGFRDMILFPEGRVYSGIMIENPSSSARLHVAIGTDFTTDIVIDVLAQGLVTFDGQTFGAFADETTGVQLSTKLRMKTNVLVGTLATATLTFTGQPTDSQSWSINGVIYEASNDASSLPGNVRVIIGATATDTYTNLRDAVNNSDPNVTASLAGSILTLTSNYGGTDGNFMTLTTNASNVTPSGINFSGGSGGVTPIIHIW